MNNQEYWIGRALTNEQRAYNGGEKFMSLLEKEYREALDQINRELETFIKRYADQNHISIAQAQRRLSKNEIVEYEQDIEKLLSQIRLLDPDIEKEMEYKYIKQKVTRLQALKNQVELQIKALGVSQENLTFEHLKDTYKEAYYRQTFDFESAGISVSFDVLNDSLVESVVKTKWLAEDFEQIIWKHNDKLVREVKDILSVAVATKTLDINKMSRKLAKRMDVNKSSARRLIRTETNYVLNQATKKSYEDAELEKYQFLATLDLRTSKICKDLDLKIINMKDMRVGVNYPPMHPNCRSTTVAYFEEDAKDPAGVRTARDATGKNILVPGDMTYDKWKEKYITASPKNVIMSDKQFGKKIGKHAADYGLNPKLADDRSKLRDIIKDIVNNHTEVAIGEWSGQKSPVIFFIKGDDVVPVNSRSRHFITLLKGGINNAWVKDARKL